VTLPGGGPVVAFGAVATSTEPEVSKIEGYLKELGWPAIGLSEGTWRSSFRGKAGLFPLVIQIADGWCRLMVLPIVRLPTDTSKAEKLYTRLLQLNGELLLARFSLDEDGDVILSVEFPVTDLDPSELRDSLDVLSFYAEKHQADLRQLVA
jgi:hypothetical protein